MEIKTGKTVARWRPNTHQPSPEADEPWFFRDGERLYVMTRGEFSEINLDDIGIKINGWE